MKSRYLFVYLMAITATVQAQYTSNGGRFQVDEKRGCAPFTVTITNANLITTGECTSGKPCNMDFQGNNNQQTNQFTFTYNTPGTYKLSVIYQGGVEDFINITVDSNITPTFDIFACAGSGVYVHITDKTYDIYTIDFNNDGVVDATLPSGNNPYATYSYGGPYNSGINVKGKKLNAASNCNTNHQPFTALAGLPMPTISTLTALSTDSIQLTFVPQTDIDYHAEFSVNNSTNFQLYQSLNGVNSMIVPTLTLDSKYYCFRLSSFDPCNNNNTYSAPVCSQIFDLAVKSGTDSLYWQTSSLGVVVPNGIQIIRTDPNNTVYKSLLGTSRDYPDKATVCNTRYCYQMATSYVSGAISTSLQKCGTSFMIDSPAGITNTSAAVSNNNTQVDLTWIQPPAYTASIYNILRSQNAGTYNPLNTATVTQFSDLTYGEGNCYKINYVDNCGNVSAIGTPSCPIQLSGNVDGKNDVHLQWTDYLGWNLGVKNYVVEKYDQNGALLQTVNLGTSTSYVDSAADANNQVVLYRIVATANESGLSTSISNEVSMVKGVNLWYPTAFNPDSKISALNKTFTVRGHYIATIQLEIFDRWGSLVFYSENNDAWDGRREGSSMPDATYVWTARGTDLLGNAFRKAGTVVLIRK